MYFFFGTPCIFPPADNYECSPNPCVHGNCIDLINIYQCNCPPDYQGVHCDTGNIAIHPSMTFVQPQ